MECRETSLKIFGIVTEVAFYSKPKEKLACVPRPPLVNRLRSMVSSSACILLMLLNSEKLAGHPRSAAKKV